LQTRRLVTSFEGLNRSSSIAWQVMELQSGAKIAANAGAQSMNTL